MWTRRLMMKMTETPKSRVRKPEASGKAPYWRAASMKLARAMRALHREKTLFTSPRQSILRTNKLRARERPPARRERTAWALPIITLHQVTFPVEELILHLLHPLVHPLGLLLGAPIYGLHPAVHQVEPYGEEEGEGQAQ